jgi:hypothetical protein
MRKAVYVGAPTGTAQALAVQLNGSVPTVNKCLRRLED